MRNIYYIEIKTLDLKSYKFLAKRGVKNGIKFS